MLAGFDAKKSEVHGMAQRGGSVISEIRFGEKVHSPLIPAGTTDYLVSFEKLEALRYAHFLSSDGLALVNDQLIVPVTVSSGSVTIGQVSAEKKTPGFAPALAITAFALVLMVRRVIRKNR